MLEIVVFEPLMAGRVVGRGEMQACSSEPEGFWEVWFAAWLLFYQLL